MHQLAEAQTDLATVQDAMEATNEALARKEQEAAYTWSTVKCECCAGAPRWGVLGSLGGMSVCVIVHFLEVSVQVLWVYAPFLIQTPKKRTGGFLMQRFLNARH